MKVYLNDPIALSALERLKAHVEIVDITPAIIHPQTTADPVLSE